MAWNLNPPWVELGNINPDRYTSIEGVYASAYNKVLENLQYLYNHLGAADIEVDSTETYFVQPGGSVSINTPDGVKTINYPGNILLYMTEEDHGEGIHTYHMKWYFVLPIPEVTVGDVNVSTTVFEPGQTPISSIQITPQQTDTGTRLSFSFNVPALRGNPGRDGTSGTDGIGISSISSQPPSQSEGYTVTPVRVLKTDNSIDTFNVRAKNGIDAAGSIKTVKKTYNGTMLSRDGNFVQVEVEDIDAFEKCFMLELRVKTLLGNLYGGVMVGWDSSSSEVRTSLTLAQSNITPVSESNKQPVLNVQLLNSGYLNFYDAKGQLQLSAASLLEVTIIGYYSESSGGGGKYIHDILLTSSGSTITLSASLRIINDSPTRFTRVTLHNLINSYSAGVSATGGLTDTQNNRLFTISRVYSIGTDTSIEIGGTYSTYRWASASSSVSMAAGVVASNRGLQSNISVVDTVIPL